MKDKIKYIVTVTVLLSLSMTMGISAELMADVRQPSLRIETTGYGQVAKKLKESGVTECDTLTIAGYMDISDFTAVKEFVPDDGNGIEMLDLRAASLKDNEVPDGALGREAVYFYGEPVLLKIRNILLPEGTVRIGNSSLCRMELKTINIPVSVREIGYCAFEENLYLDCEIEIPYGVDCIDSSLFYDCRSLKTAPKLPETIRTIWSKAFEACGFEEISLPEGLQKIDFAAFSKSSIEKIKLPSTCSELSETVFSECPNLEELDMKASSIEYIPPYLAVNSNNLRTLRLPLNCKKIMWDAFINCDSLQIVEFNEGLEVIDLYSFSSKVLETVTFPSTLRVIGPFSTCPKLLTVYCKAPVPPRFNYGQGPLVTNIDKATLYVPEGTKDAYATADGWKDFAHIEEIAKFPNAGVSPCLPDNVINDNNLYDLEGRKVSVPVPGRIYIRNGKKIKLNIH